uniref:Uncharacterized protein LOC102805027 n=1 Tax=Saccoglossus kowalevskii TaxID=10224 RepID=A0ABM0MTA7_SACKO|nr:PREDICTED: uncharacterized protein LOC102805027 [Saccoglossus kowalevskii]
MESSAVTRYQDMQLTCMGLLAFTLYCNENETQDFPPVIMDTLTGFLNRGSGTPRSEFNMPIQCEPVSYANFVLKHCNIFKSCEIVEETVDIWEKFAKPVELWITDRCSDHLNSNSEWDLPIAPPCNLDNIKSQLKEKHNRTYEEFHNFNFDMDDKFQTGLKSILRHSSPDKTKEEAILEAKIFYYNRFHQQVSLGNYKTWLEQRKSETQSQSALQTKETKYTHQVDEYTDSGANGTTDADAAGPQYPSSFFDLLQKIEKGEPLPGVEELNIQPTNTPATESSLATKMKPWEH